MVIIVTAANDEVKRSSGAELNEMTESDGKRRDARDDRYWAVGASTRFSARRKPIAPPQRRW
jgi:hypothetical protein